MTGEIALLRPLEASDQDFLNEMTYEALRGTIGDISPEEKPTAFRLVESYAGGWGDRRHDTGLVAHDVAGEMIGAAWYRIDRERFKDIDTTAPSRPILSMAVQSEARGRGVGRTLLEGLMDRASASGIRFLTLSVALDNKVAKELYESVGFTEDVLYQAGLGSQSAEAMKMSAPTHRP